MLSTPDSFWNLFRATNLEIDKDLPDSRRFLTPKIYALLLAMSFGVSASHADVVREAYLKASNPGTSNFFGHAVAVDGDTAIVAAYLEGSSSTDPSDNSAPNAGAAYIFHRAGNGAWTQQAYLKAANAEADDRFGYSVAISGNLAVVGAYTEDGAANTINGNEASNTASSAGAAYVFLRDAGGQWSQEAYLKPANSGAGDLFGFSVAISGNRIVVGALNESGGASGVDGNGADNSLPQAGAAYVFERDGAGTWSQVAYLKAANPDEGDRFGASVAIDGDWVAVGSSSEDGSGQGIDQDGGTNGQSDSGAAYVFRKTGAGTWEQEAYVKASNADAGDGFGRTLSLSGETLIVGASGEASSATGVNGDEYDNGAAGAGAAYIFQRDPTSGWSQSAYLKASNTAAGDQFGNSVSISGDLALVGAISEDSNSTEVNGDASNNGKTNAGAVYSFIRLENGSWIPQAYLKSADNSSYSSFGDNFGSSVAVSGGLGVIGAPQEDSSAAGVNGDSSDNSLTDAGAAYTFSLPTEPLAPAIQITISPDGNVVEYDAYLDFGGARVSSLMFPGDTVSRTFTITNIGNAVLTDLSVTGGVEFPEHFTFDLFGLPTQLEPGSSADFDVYFHPTVVGPIPTQIQIGSNDPTANPFYISIVGEGTEPIIEVLNSANESLFSGWSRIDFGGQPVGSVSAPENLTITNTGSHRLTLSGVFLYGPNPEDFSVDLEGLPEFLDPWQSATLPVRYQPSATRFSQADLYVSSDSGWGLESFHIGLDGVGTTVALEVSSPLGTPLSSGVSAIHYGEGYVAGAPVTRSFNIRNSGGAPLTDVAVELTGLHAGDFTVEGSELSGTLEPGADEDFEVTFSPGAPGPREATLQITSSDPDGGPFLVALNGEGIDPELEVRDSLGVTIENGALLNWGELRVGSQMSPGTPVTKVFTITNLGTTDIEGLSASLGVGAQLHFFLDDSGLPAVLAPGATATVSVSFAPRETGTHVSSLILTSNDADESPWSLQFEGVGVAPLLKVQDPLAQPLSDYSSYNFGVVSVGQTSTVRQFTVSNEGTSPLSLLGLNLDEGDDFVIVENTLPAELAAGESATVSLRFDPQEGGARYAELRFSSDDNRNPEFRLSLMGTGAAPEIDVQEPAGTSLVSAEATVDFGNLPANSPAFANKSFLVTNAGLEPLTGLVVSVAGAHPGDFVPNLASFPSSLAPGQSATVKIRFSSSEAGARSAELRVASNDTDENPFLITLTGTGDSPLIGVRVLPAAPLESGVSVVGFGDSLVASVGTPKEFVVANDGTAALTGLTISLEGAHPEDYELSSVSAATLAPGESATFQVTFTAGGTGARDAVLRISGNETVTTPFLVSLSGTGIAPEIEVSTLDDGILQTGVSVADFGPVEKGSSGSARSFTVRNTGGYELGDLGLSLAGAVPSDYHLDATGFPGVLAPGTEASFTITFAPTQAGDRQALLRIANNVDGKNPFEIALFGIGTVPEIDLSETEGPSVARNTEIDFGAVRTGVSSPSKSYTLTNSGTGALNDLAIQVVGPHSGEFALEAGALPTSLAPGASAQFTLGFAPTATGLRSASIEISSNDEDENPFLLQLTGTGIAPEIRVVGPDEQDLTNNGPGIAFGGVNGGAESTPLFFTVHNDGTADLIGISLAIGGPHAAEFLLNAPGFPTTLAPGTSVALTVTFSPASDGVKSGMLQITSDDDEDSPFFIPLSGVGQSPEIEITSETGDPLASGGEAVDLGSSIVGDTSPAIRLTITNTGSGPLEGVFVRTTGTFRSDFTVSSESWSPDLAPGESNEFDIFFVPGAAGLREAVLEVLSNDADENPFLIPVKGQGLAPDIALSLEPDVSLSSEGPAIFFGDLRVGAPAISKSFTVANEGSSLLSNVSLEIVGDGAGDFILAADAVPSTIAVGASHEFTISFLPTAGGLRSAELVVVSDDPDEIPFLVRLNGTGIEPEIEVSHLPSDVLQTGANFIGFGAVLLGESGSTESFVITNSGSAILSNLACEVVGGAEADFILDLSELPTSLGPGESAGFSVSFVPTELGERQTELRILSDDADENPFTVGLLGAGIAPEIQVEFPEGEPLATHSSEISFGGIPRGFSSTTRTVVIRNAGTAPLLGISATINGPDGGDFQADVSSLQESLFPGDSSSLTLTFTPTLSAARSATLTIASSDSDENPFIVNLSGSGQAPEIEVAGIGGSDLVSGTAQLSFGPVRSGTSGEPITLTVSNTGAYPLANLAVAVDGNDSADFILDASSLPATLAPDTSANFSVRFDPTGPGTRSTSLRIVSDDADENPFVIALTGEGTAPKIAVNSATAGDLVLGSATVDLGALRVGSISEPEIITITNSGTAPLELLGITLGGAQADELALDGSFAPTSLAPSASTSFSITFSPDALGGRLATLAIQSDDIDGSPFFITFSLTAQAPEILVTHDPSTSLFSEASGVLFQSALVGEAGSTESFTVTNIGNFPLENLAVSIEGSMAGDFTLGGDPLPNSLAADTSATFTVSFLPTAAGERTAELRIASNDADENPFLVTLAGLGLAPDITVESFDGEPYVSSASSISMGGIPLGLSSPTSTLVIRNDGTAPLLGISATITGTDSGDFDMDVSSLQESLLPDESTTLTLTFTPTASSERNAALSITSNDADENPFVIALTGSGQAPEINVAEVGGNNLNSGEGLGFRAVRAGTSGETITLVVSNEGDYPLGNLSAAIDGAHAADFLFDGSGLPATLDPGESANITVEFAPAAAGVRTATLRIANDDVDENPFIITLTGEGTAPVIAVHSATAGDLVFGSAAVDLGAVRLGNTSAPETITITNSGTAPLELLDISLGGAQAGELTLDTSSTATTLPPEASTTLGITFSPKAIGSRFAILTIQSDDTHRSPFVIALSGTGEAPEIAITHNPSRSLSTGTSSVLFQSALVGEAGSTESFTVTNTGNVALENLAVSIVGAMAGDFTLGGDPLPDSLAANTSATFAVSFGPTAAGERTSELRITSNDADENPFLVTLAGSGLAPDILVESGTGEALASGGPGLSFGGVPLSFTSSPVSVVIRNVGTAPLLNITASIGGVDAGDFQADLTGLEASLAPGDSTTLTVTFTPTLASPRNASLSISSNDAEENPFIIPLSGTGQAPEIEVAESGGAGLDSGSSQLDFGPVRSGTAGGTITLSVSNTGAYPLGNLSLAIVGEHASDFSADNAGLPASLEPEESATFSVSFDPSTSGIRSALLHITSDDADENPFVIALTGEGTAPVLSLSSEGVGTLPFGSAAVDFGSGRVATEAVTRTLTLSNEGTAPLIGIAAQITGATAGDFSLSPATLPTSLGAGESQVFTVSFSPTSSGDRSAQLSLVSDDASRNPFLIMLSATGEDPEIAVELAGGVDMQTGVSAVPLPATLVGESAAPVTLTVRNLGNVALGGLSLSLDGPDSGDFTLGGDPFPSSIDPGASADFTLTFSPSAVGARSANLVIASDDRDENPFSLLLTAIGLAPEITVSPETGSPFVTGTSTIPIGNIALGASSSPIVVIIRNDGSAPLTGIAASLEGSDATDYALQASALADTLDPGQSTSLTVTSTPSALGARSAQLRITSNDADENPFLINLTSTGTAPEIQLAQDGDVLVSGEATLDFASVPVDAPGVGLSFTLSNVGSHPLDSLALSIEGTEADDFQLSTTSFPTSLDPEAGFGFSITFAPESTGPRQATLRIASNDADENPFLVSLAGTGTAPRIALSGPGGDALDFGSAILDFAAGPVGETAAAQAITVTNSGTATLTGISVSIAGTAAADFAFTPSPFPASLEPEESATLSVDFTPSATGARSATLAITSNDGARSPFPVALSGAGQAPEIAVSEGGGGDLTSGESSLSFGESLVGGTGTPIQLALRNDGSYPLENIALSLEGADAADFSLDGAVPTSLDPAASAELSVSFSPSSTGPRTAQLRIASSDADENPFVISVGGTGVTPEIRITEIGAAELTDGASTVDFGIGIIEGTAITRTFQVSNDGTGPLTGLGVVIANGSDAGYTLDASGLPASLAAGLSGTFTVSFSARGEGVLDATVAVSSNDADEHPFTFTVSSIGRYPVNVRETAYLKASNADAGDAFGGGWVNSVALSGDTLVVGAPDEDGTAANPDDNTAVDSGAVYVCERTEAGAWQQSAYLKATGVSQSNNFGYSVAIDGDTLVVGSLDDDIATESGAAYVFRRDNDGQWSQIARLKAPNPRPGELFGLSVAVSGGTVAVGAIRRYGTEPGYNYLTPIGSALVYEASEDGGYHLAAEVTALHPGFGDFFGADVALSGNILVVGAPLEEGLPTGDGSDNRSHYQAGAAYVFERNSSGQWPQTAYLKETIHPAPRLFGRSVDIDQDRIVVGSDQYQTFSDTGEALNGVLVFQRQSDGTWALETQLIGSNLSTDYSWEPASVAISGATVVVGFEYDDNSPIGPSLHGGAYTNSGAGYVFSLTADGEWVEETYLKASNAGSYDYFGSSVAISGETIAFGAEGEDGGRTVDDNSLTNSGAAYIFNRRARPLHPAIAVSNSEGSLVSGTSSIDFGTAPAGSSGERQYFTITNTGEGVLRDLEISIHGSQAGVFPLQTFAYPDSLVPGDSMTVVLGFQPVGPGAQSAELRIASNDPEQAEFLVTLTGTGGAPDLTPRPDIALEMEDGTPLSSLSSSVAFGFTEEEAVATRRFVLRNTGNAPLQAISLSLIGGSTEFSMRGTAPPTTLAAGESAPVEIAFSPLETGPRSVVLSIASNDPDENPFQVVLRGEMEVAFPDANLESAIRSALSLPTGPIPAAAVATLVELDLSNLGLTNLEGLEYAINLKNLNLSGNNFPEPAPNLSAFSSSFQLRLIGTAGTDRESVWDLLEGLGPFTGLFIDFLRPSGNPPPAYLNIVPLIQNNGQSIYLMIDPQDPPIIDIGALEIDTSVPENLESINNLSDTGVTVETGTENLKPAVTPNFEVTDARQRLVTLDGSSAQDLDGFITSWEWQWDGGSASGTVAAVELPNLTTSVDLTVTDDGGASTTRTITIDFVDAYLAEAGVPPESRSREIDFNHNGLPNLMDFAYGLDPAVTPVSLPVLSEGGFVSGQQAYELTGDSAIDTTQEYALWRVLLPEDSAGVTLGIEASADLEFQDLAPLIYGGSEPAGDGLRRANYITAEPHHNYPQMFLRISITAE